MIRFAFALLLTFVSVCGNDPRPRCSECGMYADVAPAFACEALGASGERLPFDAPRCMFKHRFGPHGREMRSLRVTEHYMQRLVPAESVVYVIGSDIVGPMGRDLVPVAREHGAQLTSEHGGRVVEYAAIDAALLQSLDR